MNVWHVTENELCEQTNIYIKMSSERMKEISFVNG